MEHSVNCVVRTVAPEQSYKLKWIVENVSNLPLYIEIKSIDFCPNDCNNFWYASLVKYESCLNLNLTQKPSSNAHHIVSDVKVLDCNGKVYYEKTEKMYKDEKYKAASLNFKIESTNFNDLKLVPNDTWYFIFVLRTYQISANSSSELPSLQMCEERAKNSFCANFLYMFENKIGADVTLVVQDDKIEAHKLVLSAQSPVFAKMFEAPMSENKKNTVVINDISQPAMMELIKFIYSKAGFGYSFDIAMELYYAADKYEVFDLRELCGKILLSLLAEDNAGMLLEMADKHKDDYLKKKVMAFINSNIKSCIKKDWWNELIGKKTELVEELMNFIK